MRAMMTPQQMATWKRDHIMTEPNRLREIVTIPAAERDQIQKPITCKDGTTISVQASLNHYCEPRSNDQAPYTKLELGYPSVVPPPYLLEFAEDADHPTETVYGWVPTELVLQFVREHGGEA